MKTADECWEMIKDPQMPMDEVIKQIQLDAFKAGERFVAGKLTRGLAGLDSNEARLLLDHKQTILTDANNRTELP